MRVSILMRYIVYKLVSVLFILSLIESWIITRKWQSIVEKNSRDWLEFEDTFT